MSIASQLQALESNISDAYDMVSQRGGTVPARKNTENLDDAIATIPSLGSVLWAASAVNPTLVGTYNCTINLHDDTAYTTTTPSSSAQLIFAASQTTYQTTGPTLDLASKRYVVFEDIIIPHVYTSTPTVTHTNCLAHKGVYVIGRRTNGLLPSTPSPNYANILTSCNATVNAYTNSSGVQGVAASSYGVYSGIVTPTLSSSTSNTPTLNFPNTAVSIRTSSSYMASGAWSLLDDTQTNMYIRWQVYEIDSPDLSDTAYVIAKNAAVNSAFQNNLIMLGGNV